MKKIIALALSAAMAFSLVACSSDNGGKVSTQKEPITILGQSSSEQDLNMIRDQLTNAGFDVTVSMQPDYSSFQRAQQAGNYDLAITGWTTVTGNVDYAVRGIFHSTGDYNSSPIIDAKIDELIDKGATEFGDEAKATYTELENRLVTENAYFVPLYSNMKLQAYNNTVLKAESVNQPKSRPGRWENYEYVNAADAATRALNLTQASSTPTSLDPIQANDGTMNTLSGNMYVKIVNLTDDDEITTDSSLSYAYAIAEGNTEYYFLLRDDVFFSKAEGGHAVNTGVRVGGEDVVFSLKRAADKNSVASHKTYTLHNHMANIEMVTDLSELETKVDAATGESVLKSFNDAVDADVASLTSSKDSVNNAGGSYQVVKVTTTEPFPQVLNYLAHQSAGVLCEEQVMSLNSKFTVESYDSSKDVCYGDFGAIKSGNNHLWCSGPYQFVTVDDYGITFEKNPGYMAESAFAPKISNIYVKFIKDASSATSAFRAGELDLLGAVNKTDVELLEKDANLTVMKRNSNGVSYCTFNLSEGSKFNNVDLRKAVLYAINQEDFVLFYKNNVTPVYSTVGTLIETGNTLVQDLDASSQHLAAYQESVAK